jgi:hypothetical protein
MNDEEHVKMMSEDDEQVVVQKTDDEVYRVDDGEILPALPKKEEEEQVPVCCLCCMYTPCEWTRTTFAPLKAQTSAHDPHSLSLKRSIAALTPTLLTLSTTFSQHVPVIRIS